MKNMSDSDRAAMQVIFDKGTAGILAQGEPARAPSGSCQYRTLKDGKTLKCAIGQVLTDEQIKKYDVLESMNPYTFKAELVNELLPGVEWSQGKDFLALFQQAHDRADPYGGFVNDFTYRANDLARSYGLKGLT